MDLLEREPFLAELRRLLDEANSGRGRLLWIGGEAGVGKSTLIRRFAAEIEGRSPLLVGACDPLATPRPLGPLLDVADALPAVDALLTDNAPRPRVFRALLGALAASPRPILFVVEDAHWADEATLDLLRYLGRRVGTSHALVVATFRDDEVGPRHPLRHVIGDLATVADVSRLTLPPLSAAAVAILATDRGVDPVALHRQTGGNPFFVTEVLATSGISSTVRDAVLARAARLPSEARVVLDAAAVLGAPADVPLLRRVAAVDRDAIDACLAGGMLETDGRLLVFRHELARQAIVAAIAPAERIALHERALRALRASSPAPPDPARLAHHAEEAGAGPAVLTYAKAAARRAVALGSHREAAAQFDRALRFADGLPDAERAFLFEALSYECYLTDQIDQAIAARRSALDLWLRVGDDRKAGENRARLAILHWAESRVEAAERQATAAIETLAALPPGPELALAYGALARIRATVLDHAAAITWGERAIALAERLGAHQILIGALITVGVTRHSDGEEQGRQQLERARHLASTAGIETLVARAIHNLGIGFGERYRFAIAAPYFEASIGYCDDHDLYHARWFSTAWLAYCRFVQGRWNDATALADTVLRAAAVSPITRVTALHVVGTIGARRGTPDAPAFLDEALTLAEGSGSLARLGPIRAARAEAAWLSGDGQRAAAEAGAAFDLALERPQPWYTGELAYWRWRTGEREAPPPRIAQPYALQIAGDWAAAASAWDDLACPYEAARVRADDGDEPALRLALATFDRLSARPAAAFVRRRLRRLGARAIPRGPRSATRGHPSHLTRREAEVLSLLAAGLTNPEIATRLFLSPRTIENHVAAILTKVAAASRADAVAAARRLGIIPPN